jgi:hypothetical protein
MIAPVGIAKRLNSPSLSLLSGVAHFSRRIGDVMRARLATPLRSTFTAAVLAVSALPAWAQATDAEASRLQAIGETYFGKPAAGEPAVVRVVPEGDHYRASLDVALLVRRLVALAPQEEVKAFSLDWAPVSAALTLREDGLWRVWDYRMPKLVAEIEGQRTEVSTDGIEFETIFDPTTGASPSMKGRFGRVTASSTIKKPGKAVAVTTESTSSDVELQGSARTTATPGVLDVAAHQTTGKLLYAIGISGGTSQGVPDMRIALTGGRQDNVVGIRGFRNTALLDLWAHLVAHHAPEDFTTGQSALKARITAALPIFEAISQKVEGTDFSLESPFVIAKAAKFAVDLDLAGLTRDGRFGMAMAVGGFQAWSLFLPKWSQKLMPRDLALAGHVSGYDVATPLSAFLDAADFSKKKPLTDEQEAHVAALFLPHGSVDVNLDGNRVVGPLYDLALDGRFTAGPAGAKGAVTVRARGLEAVSELLATEKDDAQARTLAGVIAMARGFADRKGDDLVWRFDFAGDAVSVNGKPLK